MNFTRISKLSKLVSNDLKRKPTIVLELNRKRPLRMYGVANEVDISIDTDPWIIPDDIKSFIEEVSNNNQSIEEKILDIYVKLCETYTYDDNVLSYIKKNDDDTFFLPDAYGRDTDIAWRAKRQNHNRRNCFEVSRILAKCINEVIKKSKTNNKFDVCILWDEAVTHYLVGVACDDYYLSLDLDDFTQIKDLTRVKTGLTIEGIKPLYDPNARFSRVLDNYNKNKEKNAKDSMEKRVNDEVSEDDVEFLRYVAETLKEDYDMDSAGMFEYMKEIVDTKIGARSRKKVWKEVKKEPENADAKGAQYTRCLIVTVDETPYIIDVTQEKSTDIFREIDLQNKDLHEMDLIPFREMSRNWEDDPYDGR